MAKRVYTPKVQPIAVQIHIQRAIIAQCEGALVEAQKMAEHATTKGNDFFGHQMSAARIAELVGLVSLREREVVSARERLVELEAQAA